MHSITKYVANDGSEHSSAKEAIKRDASLRGLTHLCPKCKGGATMNGKAITKQERDHDAEGYAGFFSAPQYKTVTVGYEQVPCDVCRGEGYTATEVTPITRTEIIGYR